MAPHRPGHEESIRLVTTLVHRAERETERANGGPVPPGVLMVLRSAIADAFEQGRDHERQQVRSADGAADRILRGIHNRLKRHFGEEDG